MRFNTVKYDIVATSQCCVILHDLIVLIDQKFILISDEKIEQINMVTEFADEEDYGAYLNEGEGILQNVNTGNGEMDGEELEAAMIELNVAVSMI